MSQPRKRVAVLISGRGSNMQALVRYSRENTEAGYDIVAVLSNRPGAGGLDWAANEGIATTPLDHTSFESREAFELALHNALLATNVDLIACAGFMRIMTNEFVTKWQDKMLNIHPSLLPLFKGLNTHARAIEAGVRIAGCSVHIVRPELDAGPILGQAAVGVDSDDTADTLARKVIKAEHVLYPKILNLYAIGKLRLEGDKVLVNSRINQNDTLFSPAI
ncbi:MAG: phosphoribosylglycinamide formyltransferase [Hyphomicrobiaceae bacterium]